MISLLHSNQRKGRLERLGCALALMVVASNCASPARRAVGSPLATAHDPAAVVRLAIDSVFNLGRFDVADRFFETGFAAEERLFAQRIRSAFPDLVIHADQVLVQGAWVAVHWRATGTHHGDLGDIKATGRRASWTGAWFWRVEGGRIVDGKQYNVWDQLGLRMQLTSSGGATR